MESNKVFSFRGLNLRGSPINKDGAYAEDCDNVLLNSRRELVKRFGYENEVINSVGDMLVYNDRELLQVFQKQLLRWNGTNWATVTLYGDGPPSNWETVDYAETNNTLYFTDTSGNNDLYKYDGKSFYRAGLPAPFVNSITGTGTGSTYVRVWYGYLDYQLNLVFGDYYQSDQLNLNPLFTLNINFDTLNSTEFPYNSSGFAIDGLTTTYPPFIYVAVSSDPTYNYEIYESTSGITYYNSPIPIPSEQVVDHSGATDTISVQKRSTSYPLEDFYDSTVVKGLPPKCKYVEVFGETLTLANRVDTEQFRPRSANYPLSVFWSDTGLGSTVETFPPFNAQNVGNTYDGAITGIFSSENELTILKERQVFYLNGILIGRAFRLTNSLSGGVGCVSHKSIVEVQGGCLFQSDRGIYFAGGGKSPIEVTDMIEPLFTEDTTGLDLSLCRAAIDVFNERVYFFIPATDPDDSLILLYDYYHKEWFKFSNYNASKGLVIVGNQIYHSNGSSLYSWSESYNDEGVAINAYYQSVFHHFGFPGLLKKFVRAILYSVGSETFDCYLKTRKNWGSSDDTNLSISFTPSLNLEDKPINLSNARSLSLIFGNDTLDQGMLINGYEIEYMPNQRTVKGDS